MIRKIGISWLVSSLVLSQPQRITSGFKETFIKRYVVERTSKAEIRPEEQIKKEESYHDTSVKPPLSSSPSLT